MKTTASLPRHSLFKDASISAVFAGGGVVSGFVLDALILSALGMGYQTDALFTALTIPLLITSLFAIQGPKVVVPIFAEYFNRNDFSRAWGLLCNLVTTSFLALVGISLVGMALSPVIVPLQIPGANAEVVSLAVRLSKILFWLVVCQGLGAILQSVFYAQQRYLIASSGRLLANVLTIIVVVLGHTHLGIQAVALGMLLGWVAYVFVLVAALSVQGFRYRWVIEPKDPQLQELVKAFRYPLSGHLLGESAMILQNFLGSFLGTGSLSMVRYASRITQSIAGIFLSSIIQVTFPLVSKHAADHDVRAQRKILLDSFQLLSLVGVPICIWLACAAEPLLILLFERGEFTRADAALTSIILGLMVPSILLSRMASIAQTPFYANHDMRTPFISDLIFTVSHTALACVLVGLLGVLGLPIAMSLAPLSAMIYIIAKLQGRFGPIEWNELWGFALRLSAACAMGMAGFVLGTRLAAMASVPYSVGKFLDFTIPTGLSLCLFVFGALLLRLIHSRATLPLALRAGR